MACSREPISQYCMTIQVCKQQGRRRAEGHQNFCTRECTSSSVCCCAVLRNRPCQGQVGVRQAWPRGHSRTARCPADRCLPQHPTSQALASYCPGSVGTRGLGPEPRFPRAPSPPRPPNPLRGELEAVPPGRLPRTAAAVPADRCPDEPLAACSASGAARPAGGMLIVSGFIGASGGISWAVCSSAAPAAAPAADRAAAPAAAAFSVSTGRGEEGDGTADSKLPVLIPALPAVAVEPEARPGAAAPVPGRLPLLPWVLATPPRGSPRAPCTRTVAVLNTDTMQGCDREVSSRASVAAAEAAATAEASASMLWSTTWRAGQWGRHGGRKGGEGAKGAGGGVGR